MNAVPKPQPDKAEILKALNALFDPDDIIELRAFPKGKKRTDAGYFDGKHRQVLTDAAVRLNAAGAAVYVNLNPIDPQLLGRYSNRIENSATATATDANVLRRRWLLLDFDPIRPKDTSATDAQLEAAKAAARACYQALKAEGWPNPIVAESGNGMHLLYPLDLPNDSTSRDLVKGTLSALAARFDDEAVKLDQAVFNAGRITKLYGTVGNKGDHTPSNPWRLSRLVDTPERDAVVTAEQLRAMQPVGTSLRATPLASHGEGGRANFDLEDFLTRLGIPYVQDNHEDAERYKLEHCPFNQEHGKGEAAIFRQSSGRLGFKCQHNSCAGKSWQDVRALIDGPPTDRRQSSTEADNGNPPPPEKLKFTEDELGKARLSPKCIVRDYLYADVATLVAPGGTGKTTLMLNEAAHIALGRSLYGLPVESPGSTLFITAEDSRGLFAARLREIIKHMVLTPAERCVVLGAVWVWDVSGEHVKLIRAMDGNLIPTTLADSIVKAYQANPPAIVVFDPLISFGADEQRVNDNEQTLITAARRIVRGLGCCVRLIHHTGKASAREKSLDQYSARGGSALSDGSRMVAVLQSWNDNQTEPLPPECTAEPGVSISALARAKLSYAPPTLPLIFIWRKGYSFRYFIQAPPQNPAEKLSAHADQIAQFIETELDRGRKYTQRNLEAKADDLQMSRKALRDAVNALHLSGRITEEALPENERRGGRKNYLKVIHQSDAHCAGNGCAVVKRLRNLREDSHVNCAGSTTAPPYREKKDGAVSRHLLSPRFPTAPATNGAVAAQWRSSENQAAEDDVKPLDFSKVPDYLKKEGTYDYSDLVGGITRRHTLYARYRRHTVSHPPCNGS